MTDLTEAVCAEQDLVGGPAGLYREVVDEQPRLAAQVRLLELESVELVDDLARLRLQVAACMGRAGGVALVLETATELVGRVRGHGRRAGTLVHEAYQRDLGGGD